MKHIFFRVTAKSGLNSLSLALAVCMDSTAIMHS